MISFEEALEIGKPVEDERPGFIPLDKIEEYGSVVEMSGESAPGPTMEMDGMSVSGWEAPSPIDRGPITVGSEPQGRGIDVSAEYGPEPAQAPSRLSPEAQIRSMVVRSRSGGPEIDKDVTRKIFRLDNPDYDAKKFDALYDKYAKYADSIRSFLKAPNEPEANVVADKISKAPREDQPLLRQMLRESMSQMEPRKRSELMKLSTRFDRIADVICENFQAFGRDVMQIGGYEGAEAGQFRRGIQQERRAWDAAKGSSALTEVPMKAAEIGVGTIAPTAALAASTGPWGPAAWWISQSSGANFDYFKSRNLTDEQAQAAGLITGSLEAILMQAQVSSLIPKKGITKLAFEFRERALDAAKQIGKGWATGVGTSAVSAMVPEVAVQGIQEFAKKNPEVDAESLTSRMFKAAGEIMSRGVEAAEESAAPMGLISAVTHGYAAARQAGRLDAIKNEYYDTINERIKAGQKEAAGNPMIREAVARMTPEEAEAARKTGVAAVSAASRELDAARKAYAESLIRKNSAARQIPEGNKDQEHPAVEAFKAASDMVSHAGNAVKEASRKLAVAKATIDLINQKPVADPTAPGRQGPEAKEPKALPASPPEPPSSPTPMAPAAPSAPSIPEVEATVPAPAPASQAPETRAPANVTLADEFRTKYPLAAQALSKGRTPSRRMKLDDGTELGSIVQRDADRKALAKALGAPVVRSRAPSRKGLKDSEEDVIAIHDDPKKFGLIPGQEDVDFTDEEGNLSFNGDDPNQKSLYNRIVEMVGPQVRPWMRLFYPSKGHKGFANGEDLVQNVGEDEVIRRLRIRMQQGRTGKIDRTVETVLKNPELFDPEDVYKVQKYLRIRNGNSDARGTQPEIVHQDQLETGDVVKVAGEEMEVEKDEGGIRLKDDIVVDIPAPKPIAIDKGTGPGRPVPDQPVAESDLAKGEEGDTGFDFGHNAEEKVPPTQAVPSAAPPSAAKPRDLFGREVTEAATGTQKQLGFERDIQGNVPTPSGWLTPEGKLKVDADLGKERKPKDVEGQTNFLEGQSEAKTEEKSSLPVPKPEPTWQIPKAEFIRERELEAIEGGAEPSEIDDMQRGMWEDEWVKAVYESPRDADIPVEVLRDLPEDTRRLVIKFNEKARNTWIEKVTNVEGPDPIVQAGLKVEKTKARNGKTVWEVTGKTYEHRDLLKRLGGKYYGPEKAWTFYDGDPTEQILGSLGRGIQERRGSGDVPPAPGSGDRDSSAEDLARKALREREDARPDRGGLGEDRRRYVGEDTEALLRRGEQHHIPAAVIQEQIEDVGMISRAFQEKLGGFVLANEAGTGKTFVLGGAIREMARHNPEERFLYVTKNQRLISQIQKDLSDYGIDKVKFTTYDMLEKERASVHAGWTVIFDEAHSVKNETKRGKAAELMISSADFTVFASATPFENPVQAAYLAPSGMFDKFPGGFHEWAKAYGASVVKFMKYNPRTGRSEEAEKLKWVGGKHKRADQIAARNWFKKQGVFTQRSKKLSPEMVQAAFRRHSADQTYVDLVNKIEKVYQIAANKVGSDPTSASQVAMHEVNLMKRVLEAAKCNAAINRAKELIAEGKQVVLFVETKADRSLHTFRESGESKGPRYDYPQIAEMMAAWRRAANMARAMEESPPRQPFADSIVAIAEAMHNEGLKFELPSVLDELSSAFDKSDVAFYTGAQTDAVANKGLDEWKDGKRKILIATMAKGGTGLSLHDVIGDKPDRVQVGLNLPWSAAQVDQVSGRLARYGTAKPVGIEWIFANNIKFERQLAGRVAGRMSDMGALVKGMEIKASDALSDFDFEDGYDPSQVAPPEAEETKAELDKSTDEVDELYRRASNLEKSRKPPADTSYDFFPTPYPIAVLMNRIAGIEPGDVVLEPSAGEGSLFTGTPKEAEVHAVELRTDNVAKLTRLFGGLGWSPDNIRQGDFLELAKTELADLKPDVVLMNPPFSQEKGRGSLDVAHVRQSYDLMPRGARLVAIMGEGPFFRENKVDTEFRQWLDEVGAIVTKLPEDTFKKSGTGVRARMVVIDKGAARGRTDMDLADMETETLRALEGMFPARGAGLGEEYSVEALKAFNLTDEQAVAVDSLAKATGVSLDDLFVATGQEPGEGALRQPGDTERLLEQFRKTRLMTTRHALGILGDMPGYLEDVARFMAEQRQRLVSGEMTARDIAKSWVMTVASQGADARTVDMIRDKLKGSPFVKWLDTAAGKDFLEMSTTPSATGKPMIRPEEAVAGWLLSPAGKRALDNLEAGRFNPKDWREMAAVRATYGDDRINNTRLLSSDPGKVRLRDAAMIADQINGANGDPDAIGEIVRTASGIGEAKTGFIKHLLGLGDSPTIDAVELNFWLTGQKTTRGQESPRSELARGLKALMKNPATARKVIDRISGRLADLSKSTGGTPTPHIMHHWIWDKVEGTATSHEGMYRAMRLAQTGKGAIEFLDDGKAIAHAMQSSDVSTAIHEILGHVVRRRLVDRSIPQELRPEMTDEDIEAAEKFCDVKDGKWDTEAEEKFATAAEAYLRDGKAPNERLRSVFEKVKGWLRKIYEYIAGNPLGKVSPQMRKFFDRLFTRSERLEAERTARDLTKYLTDNGVENAKAIARSYATAKASGNEAAVRDLLADTPEIADWEGQGPPENRMHRTRRPPPAPPTTPPPLPPTGNTPPETKAGKRLIQAIERDIKSGKAKVGDRSIIQHLMDAIKAQMMIGKTQTTRMSPGVYQNPAHVVRTREGGATWNYHEAGHAMSALIADNNPRWFAGYAQQLEDLTRAPGTCASSHTPEEGFAELIRRYVLDPTSIQGTLRGGFESALARAAPNVLAALRDTQRAHVLHRSRPMIDQLRAYMNDKGPPAKGVTGRVSDLAWQTVYNLWVGGDAQLLRMTRQIYRSIVGGRPSLVKEAFSRTHRAMNQIAREALADLKNSDADFESSYYARGFGIQRGTVALHGSGSEKGIRVHSHGTGFGEIPKTTREMLRGAGFVVPEPTNHGELIEIHPASLSDTKDKLGDDWDKFQVWGQFKAVLERHEKAGHDYPMMDRMTPADLKVFVDEQERLHPEWEGYRKEVQTFMDQALLVPVLSGEISASEAIAIKQKWESYWPLPRELERIGRTGTKSNREGDLWSGIARAFGSEAPFKTLDEAVRQRVRKTIEAYYENGLRRSLVKMQDRLSGNRRLPFDARTLASRFLIPLHMESEVAAKLPAEEVRRRVAEYINQQTADELGVPVNQLGDAAIEPDDVNISEPWMTWRSVRPRAVNVITVSSPTTGRKYYQVPDEILYDMLAQGKKPAKYLEIFSRAMAGIQAPAKRAIVENIAFGLVNAFARDPITAMWRGDSWRAMIPGYYLGMGIIGRIKGRPEGLDTESELLRRRLESMPDERGDGLLRSFFQMLRQGIVPDQPRANAMEVAVDLPGQAMSVLLKPLDVLNWLTLGRFISGTLESVPREGSYLDQISRGMGPLVANVAFNKNTLDFGEKAGSPNAAAIYRAAFFLNPSLRAAWAMCAPVLDPDPRRRAARVATRIPAIMAVAAAVAAANILLIKALMGDKSEKIFKDMRRRKNEDRSNFMALGGVVRFPFEGGPLGAAMSYAYNSVESWLLGRKADPTGEAKLVLKKIRSGVPGPTDLLNPYLRTPLELGLNWSFFRNSEVVPPWMKERFADAPELQTFPDTPTMYNNLGDALGASPIAVQYGVQQMLSRQYDEMIRFWDAYQKGKVKGKDVPLVGRLMQPESVGFRSAAVAELAAKEHDYQIAKSRKLPVNEADHYAWKAVQDVWDEIREERKKGTPDQKKIDGLQEKMTEVAERFLYGEGPLPDRFVRDLVWQATEPNESKGKEAREKHAKQIQKARDELKRLGLDRKALGAALREEAKRRKVDPWGDPLWYRKGRLGRITQETTGSR